MRKRRKVSMHQETENNKSYVTANQFLGAGIFTTLFGAMTKISAGYICPACLVLTPLLFTIGIIKKLRIKFVFNRN